MLIAAVQLTSKAEKKKNLAVAKALMERGVRQGAELVALPEYFASIGNRETLLKDAEKFGEGPAYEFCADFAKKHEVWVLAGSIPTKADKTAKDSDKRLINRSSLFDPKGKIVATYDKIHLFDTELMDSRAYNESEMFRAGAEPRVVDTPFGKIGMTVCYDLRFPELFRTLSRKGARMIFVPSAFTMYTGKDHWMPLLRARAIENQCYIVAPAQYGKHSETKTSFGKTCIIDPWGNLVAQAPDCETVILADVDFKFLAKVRKELPALKHAREDLFPLK